MTTREATQRGASTTRDVEFVVDNENVRGTLHLPSTGAPRSAIVMLHGLLSDRREFADAPARLAALGHAALAFDERGHGDSDGAPRTRFAHERVAAEAAAAAKWLDAQGISAPRVILGHSLGSACAVFALATQPATWRAGVLVAPLASIRAELSGGEFAMYRVAYAVSRAKAGLGLGALVVPYKNKYEDLFVDADAAKRAKAVGFLAPNVSLANYPAYMAVDAPAWARRVSAPVIAFVGKHDKAVKRANSMRVFDALTGPKELVELDSGHSAFGDRDATRLTDTIDSFVRKNA
ncbi:MAG: alpha/beta hydrolase [Thermoplasmatota archaeon]